MLLEAVWVCFSCGGSEEPATLLSAHRDLHMGSLARNNIGEAGARDLGAALQVNTTLTTLE